MLLHIGSSSSCTRAPGSNHSLLQVTLYSDLCRKASIFDRATNVRTTNQNIETTNMKLMRILSTAANASGDILLYSEDIIIFCFVNWNIPLRIVRRLIDVELMSQREYRNTKPPSSSRFRRFQPTPDRSGKCSPIHRNSQARERTKFSTC